MTADESRVFIRLLQFSLGQAELLSMVTTTVFQWMDNQESMQALRDETVKRLAAGDKSQDVLVVLTQLSEETQRACLTHPAMTTKLFNALAKSDSERDKLAALIADWKSDLEI